MRAAEATYAAMAGTAEKLESTLKNFKGTADLCYAAMRELHSGKCQDEVCSNRQRFTHVEIMQAYAGLGFVVEDLFVLVRQNKPGASRVVKLRPNEIVFDAWPKGEVAEGRAGTLVRMAEGQSVTFKLTKKPDGMRRVEDLPDWARMI